MILWYRRLSVLLFLLIMSAGGCFAKRDDSTGRVRQIVADHLNVDLNRVTAETTIRDLGCTRSQFRDLIGAIEDDFSTALSAKDLSRLDGDDDSWKCLRVIDLANMVRPEWNKPLLQRKEVEKMGTEKSCDVSYGIGN